MGVTIPTVSQDTADTVAGVAGLVANIVAPGSGAVVAKAVQAGAQVLNRIAGIFNKEKKSGKTDSQAAAAAAATPLTEAEKAEIRQAAMLGDNVRQYLENITPEDLRLSTIFKDAKMKPGADDFEAIAAEALSSGKIKGDLLGVYSYFATGESNQYASTLGIGTGTGYSQPASIGGGSGGGYQVGAVVPGGGGGLRPGEPEKPVTGGWEWGNLFALVAAGGAGYIWFVASAQWDKWAGTLRKRQAAANKARKVKQEQKAEEAAAAAKKRPTPRKTLPKKQ